MKKFIRVIEIILLVFVFVCGVALFIGYLVDKDYTMSVLTSIKDFINQPLPIVGVSILSIGIFVYEIILRTNYGKKAIKRIEEDKEKALARIEEKELQVQIIAKEVEEHLKAQDINIDELKGYICELCGLNLNVKAEDLLKRIKGELDNGEENENGQAVEE